ncbi:vegetative cell wall protein gp1-like [Poecilia latipinna]|uniref:vegetative cell wall protein gp1-like n=1 Tax=Poecilia latipinna TaxID=48699 RepID=UPI00072ECFBE|nr:PREDICTED: vegetative cell wall protein gp1-like [Poecilia latipinna]
MGRGKVKNPAVCLAAVVILTCYWVKTTDCFRLRKSQRRIVQRETGFPPSGRVQEGKIVFGRVFEVPYGSEKHSKNASVDDETDYQSDFAGWSQQADMEESSKEKWNPLATSLHCFGDHMKFRSLGPGAPQLAVEQAHEPPMPLSMVPPKCGYRMHGDPMAFVLMAPYDGCNMIQQGGNYMLPLLWQGHPLSLLCPKPARTKVPRMPQVPRMPSQPYFDFYSHLFPAPAEPAKPVPQPPELPLYLYLHPFPPQTTAPPPTTSVPKVPYPQIPFPPYFPVPYWPQFPEFPPFLPYPTEKPPKSPTSGQKTTAISSKTTESPEPTQGPSDAPGQLYPLEYLPVVPNEHFPHMFYSHKG